jgi:hypothetical protein
MGIAVVGAMLTLQLMWRVTTFGRSLEDIAVLFYALFAISPYWKPLQYSLNQTQLTRAGFTLAVVSLLVAATGLHAYYDAFIVRGSEQSGFLFLFVPCGQWAAFLGLERLLDSD